MNKDTCKFHARHSSGKYTLDVMELRNQFLLSETLTQKIRSFRLDRISACNADEMPVLMEQGPKVVLHIIPFDAFYIKEQYDLLAIFNNFSLKLNPLQKGDSGRDFNFEGLVFIKRSNSEQPTSSYLQLFRNGIIEAVDTSMLSCNNDVTIKRLYEIVILDSLKGYFDALKEIGIEPPFIIALSLLDIKGYCFAKSERYFSSNCVITKKDLLMPEILVESFDDEISTLMKPAFDMVWNACGYTGSQNYDSDGKLKPS